MAEGVPCDTIAVITNAVDLDRLVTRASVSTPLRRAAIFGNNATAGNFVRFVRGACARVGLSLDEFGSGLGRTLHEPERALANYDVVFAKARCAIEAMAAGCAVLVVDEAGYGGLVTSGDVDWLLDWNVGNRCLQRHHDESSIEADLRRVDADDARRVSERVRQRCNLPAAVDAYERVYQIAIASEPTEPSAARGSWQGAQVAIAQYATELEARLRAGDGVWSMPPLSPASLSGMTITLRTVPRIVSPSESFTAEVEITNRSRENLATVGTTPIHLSYHWMSDDGHTVTQFNGVRTRLTRSVGPDSVHQQRMEVHAPAALGRHRLRVTLVQESVSWFTNLSNPIFDDGMVCVGDKHKRWNLAEIAALDGMAATRDAFVDNLGFLSSPLRRMLAYAETEGILETAIGCGCSAVIVPPPLAARVPSHIGLVESAEPSETFRRLHELLAVGTNFYGDDTESRIDPRARVHPSATVDGLNVDVGAHVEVGAGSVICGRVTLGKGAVIGPGAVIGAAGFQTMRSEGRPVELSHVGAVTIGEGSIVFANATIARGLFRQSTEIGQDCRVGNNSFVSHNSRIGARSIVGHGAIVNGNVLIGNDAWIGPGVAIANNLVIGDGVRIDLGSTVIGSLQPAEHVAGPPAIDRGIMLREVASWRARRRRG